MFDIGGLELIVIGIVALIVVGPKDLPGMFRTAGQFMGRMRGMAREFQRSMEDAADQSGLSEATKDLRKMNDLGLNSATKSAQNFAKDFMDNKTASKAEPIGPKAPPKAASAPKSDAPQTTTPAQATDPAVSKPETTPVPDS
ncbi:MAG: Sec-independent protein translocase protein TatB [Pseudomonadota bacterium]